MYERKVTLNNGESITLQPLTPRQYLAIAQDFADVKRKRYAEGLRAAELPHELIAEKLEENEDIQRGFQQLNRLPFDPDCALRIIDAAMENEGGGHSSDDLSHQHFTELTELAARLVNLIGDDGVPQGN